MLKTILAISGKPGLYKLVSRGTRSLIVETLDEKHRRVPAFGTDKVISLADIAMYTDDEEMPLATVLNNVKTLEEGKPSAFNYKKASKEDLFEYMAKVLPNFDRDRVFPNDVKKLIQWYNILMENGINEFEVAAPAEEATEEAAEAPAEETATAE
ncbi:MAG: DUF5606 domain-containing protein [Bacteroidaceae bacterium]|nr:DUF5606 domain-containing protein [Bacteroidaceae bacterium]